MDQSPPTTVHLDTGNKILIQADTAFGHVTRTGEVVDVGNYAFRVKCDEPLTTDELEPGQRIRISLTDRQNILPVETQYVRVLDDNPHIVILRLPSSQWRKNRRTFFRGEIHVNAILIKSEGERLKGYTDNISGGGALLRLDVELSIGDELECILVIPKQEKIGVRVRVVWANHQMSPKAYGIKFINIKSRAQNRICRMVMVQEFEQRRATIRELNERNAIR